MSVLVLVRHGESRWNLENRFAGWVDVPLSEKGIMEAIDCAKYLQPFEFDVAFTSKLTRAQTTLMLILPYQKKTGIFLHDDEKGDEWSLHPMRVDESEMPIYSSEALNERYYGKLQGQNKQQAREVYGEEQVFIWRRSFDIAPPNGESLKDTYERTIPYFKDNILPFLEMGKNVIVVAHGNSLRSVVKYIENISDEDIPKFELNTGDPVIYDHKMGKFTKRNI
ncbi:2,3-bisphosphoglycerate-dependent phosphoglycerate mutase [uncultured Methanomethylovorans sp.]|uniref:2,3-bisphosphoglycerate-dependent phosphoglycerate mutase n=1 Tax=uncultured Methanomethylovorans sp. TaxID=183759 RepID=UPI002603AD13|nr:2,3-bisphosphoglycerate-dependent phosphoglycerate mutase [uncultured Methanomethylovorans sp.]